MRVATFSTPSPGVPIPSLHFCRRKEKKKKRKKEDHQKQRRKTCQRTHRMITNTSLLFLSEAGEKAAEEEE